LRVAAVTTFYPTAWDIYAKEGVRTFLKHWQIPLFAYYEGVKQPDFQHERLRWKSIDDVEDRRVFRGRYKNESLKDYRRKVVTYCHKVFAMTEPEIRDGLDILIWLDSDVHTFRPVDDEALSLFCPGGGEVASYLGRSWTHSETGWLAFNLYYHGGRFLDDLRAMYTSGEIVKQRQQHDCQAFDMTRELYQRDGHAFKNLSDGAVVSGVFDKVSPLRNYMRHHKGDRKFKLPQQPVYG
jgi:hypothetical protein